MVLKYFLVKFPLNITLYQEYELEEEVKADK